MAIVSIKKDNLDMEGIGYKTFYNVYHDSVSEYAYLSGAYTGGKERLLNQWLESKDYTPFKGTKEEVINIKLADGGMKNEKEFPIFTEVLDLSLCTTFCFFE